MSNKIPPVAVATSNHVLVALPDGRWLALDREVCEAALIAGARYMPASAPSSANTAIEPLLDAAQAAALFGVTTRLVEDLARAEIIPRYAVGERSIRFLFSELKAHFRKEGALIP
jgi:hypothetical protein